MSDLKSVHTLDLLAEILRRNPPGPGPIKSEYGAMVKQSLIAVGRDHTVRLTLYPDDIKAIALLNESRKA